MKTETLTLVLDWLKANNAHSEGGQLRIPTKLRESVIEIVGDNGSFKNDLDHNYIPKNFLYYRILVNKDFAFKLDEKFWWEQFQVIQNQTVYFRNIRHKELDPMESTDFQINEKIKAIEKLEYFKELSSHLEMKMKCSPLWMNELTYLLG